MIGVITGDVINSRAQPPNEWLEIIKHILKRNEISRTKYDIFRGDMFQVEVPSNQALGLAIELKAAIKEVKNLDLRMAIGFGKVNYSADTVLESNGEAYIFSGQEFELLKKKNLQIKTRWDDFNSRWNLVLDLALLTMNSWAPTTASIFKSNLQNQDKTQKQVAKMLNKSSSSISEGLSRAGYNEIAKMIDQFNLELEYKLNKK